jgi:hypothetical protein
MNTNVVNAIKRRLNVRELARHTYIQTDDIPKTTIWYLRGLNVQTRQNLESKFYDHSILSSIFRIKQKVKKLGTIRKKLVKGKFVPMLN